ncbi:hypothetical protein J3R30DRAFT_3699623 [Lentinula aciculospora]|uniref:Cyclin N-terminal domain-containing protein n=1 Tax=Lentinula aciculospora TaxID=153920 RepID=A0A9W9AGH4_9AGAR|nr:hypothetical protein J3R30DRAFT_3699623 [Lentinula aciculospora]
MASVLRPFSTSSSHITSRSKHSTHLHSSATQPEAMVTSSKQATIPPPVQSKTFYGQEAISRLCARFITHLFGCPERPPNQSGWHVELPYYIAYAIYRTKLPECVVFSALALLQRLKSRFPSAKGSSGHRLFISVFMIASKVMCDDTYSNKSWSVVAQGMFTVREVNQMEREMCGYLDWELTVEGEILSPFQARITQDFAPLQGPYPNYSLQDVSKRAAKAIVSKPNTPVPSPDSTTFHFPSFSQKYLSPVKTHTPAPATITTIAMPHSSSTRSERLHVATKTPSPSYSNSTSPASSISPQTPVGGEDFYSRIQVYTSTSPPEFSIKEKTVAGWPINNPLKNDIFARAVPTEW